MLEGLKKAFLGLTEKLTTASFSEKDIEKVIESFKLQLISNDVALEVAERIAMDVAEKLRSTKYHRFSGKEKVVNEILESTIRSILIEVDPETELVNLVKRKQLEGRPAVILFVGPNGGGKTTSVVKMAKYLKDRRMVPIISCSDTFRAGAIEQIKGLAEKVGVRTVSHKYGSDPAAVALDAIEAAKSSRSHVVLIDTAGRTEVDRNLLEEMKKIRRVTNPDIVIYVGDALTGNAVVEQAKRFDEFVGIDYIILAKLDADTKGGSAISISYVTKKPILFVGVGQSLDDLEPFNVDRVVKLVLGKEAFNQ